MKRAAHRGLVFQEQAQLSSVNPVYICNMTTYLYIQHCTRILTVQFISAFYKIRKEVWLGHFRPRDGKETWRSKEKDPEEKGAIRSRGEGPGGDQNQEEGRKGSLRGGCQKTRTQGEGRRKGKLYKEEGFKKEKEIFLIFN